MKTIKISKADGQGGLIFDTVETSVAYEMKLSGRVTFIAGEDSSLNASLGKAAANPDHDYDQLLPALIGAAFRILEEGDLKVDKISKLQASIAEELGEAIMDSEVKLAINPEAEKELGKDTKK